MYCRGYKQAGTAKVGAISEAQIAQSFQNCKKGDPLGSLKLQLVAKYEKKMRGDPLKTLKNSQKKSKIEIFERCHSAKNVKGGTLWDILTFILLQIIETIEGGLWCNTKIFGKKSHSSEKN